MHVHRQQGYAQKHTNWDFAFQVSSSSPQFCLSKIFGKIGIIMLENILWVKWMDECKRMDHFMTNIFIALRFLFKNKQVSTCRQCLNKQKKYKWKCNKETQYCHCRGGLNSVWTCWFWQLSAVMSFTESKETLILAVWCESNSLWIQLVLYFVSEWLTVFNLNGQVPQHDRHIRRQDRYPQDKEKNSLVGFICLY